MVHAWLDDAGLITRRVDARDWIATDDQFGAAEVDRKASSHNIREGVQADDSFEVLITEGFIGKTETGDTTTLGRGGSDYTASLIASAIDAACLEKINRRAGHVNGRPAHGPRSSSHC